MLVFSFVAAFVAGFFAHQQGWHAAPLRWAPALAREPGAVLSAWRARAALPVVALDLPFGDYQRLVALRDRALYLGYHVPSEDEAVPAALTGAAGQREPVDLRLPGGPPIAPGGAWALEMRRSGESAWLRLTPLDAARAASAWQPWGYLDALRREGFAAATQTPVRLEVNGSAWGLYLLERPAPVEATAHFDAQAAWEALASGEALPEDAFRYALAAGDAPAAARLRALQAREVALPELCDAEALGRFLGLTAFWTGAPAPDWRTLRWRYDPETQRLSPVGAGQPWTEIAPLPAALYADPAVQAAYARALAELSRPAYLEQLRRERGLALAAQWRALGGDPAAEPWALLEAHQRAMRARLAPERAVAARLEPEGAGFVLRLANRQPFPVQIVGLDAGGAALRPLDPAWVPAEERAHLVEAGEALVLRAATGALPQPVRLHLPREMTAAGGDTLAVVYHLWGVDGPELRVPVAEPELIERAP